jgi:Fe-S cluster assembly iron-binding protein IscA
MNLDIFVKENIITHEYHITISDAEFVDLLTFCKRHLGVKYSIKQILMIGIKKIFHLTINEYNGDEAFICSEWGARVLKSLRFLHNAKLDYVTPSDFNEILTQACHQKPNLIYRVNF